MVTPLTEENGIDEPSARTLINYLMDHHTNPFILGTTGEGPFISPKQRKTLVRVLLENRRDGIPVLAGVMGLSQKDTIHTSNEYFTMGVDAVVVALPGSYQLRDHQIEAFYKSISEQIKGDLILYNIPKLAHQSIPVHIADKLSQRKNIIGIKDSELDEERLAESLQEWEGRGDFFHLTGVNGLMLKGLTMGSNGIVPGTANISPGLYYDLYTAAREGAEHRALQLFEKSSSLSALYQKGNTLGESLAGLKTILSFMGMCRPFMTPPLSELSEEAAKQLLKGYRDFE